MTKHTPGPWRVETTGIHIRPVGRSGIVAAVYGADGYGQVPAETAANARLIAAAPELLEALQKAIEYLEATRPKGKVREIFTQLNQLENDVLKPARAAIQKATTTL